MGKSLLFSFIIILLPSGLLHASGAQSASKEYHKANKLFAAAKYEEALPLYQNILTALPKNVRAGDVYSKIGDSYFRLGDFKNALGSYRNAIREQKHSEQPQTQYWIGFCSFLIGRDEEAVSELLKIPELYPDSGMWIATAYYWAGRASERMGNKEQAAEFYKKASGNGKSTQGRYALKKAEAVKKGPGSGSQGKGLGNAVP